MEPYILVLAGLGGLILLTAWLPMLLKEAPLSLPIACVIIGAAIFGLLPIPGGPPDPAEYRSVTERMTELVVIISLMGAGLKIDRPFALRRWNITWRLLGPGMVLTIVLLTVAAHLLLGLGAAAALLLAACLAPTDPVLASDVQVGPPRSGEEDEVRFALTSEAGLNDGLAFPFVLLAVMLAGGDRGGEGWWSWFTYAVLWKIAAGTAAGYLLGRGLAWAMFHMPNRANLSRTGAGFVALGVTLLVYGATELVGGYGFFAVFVAALVLRASEPGHEYHKKLHDFAEELERLLMMALLVLLGGAVAAGGLLAAVDIRVVVFAVVAIFVVRPLAGWIALWGTGRPTEERATIAFFGIRGLGSFYYLAFALGHAEFQAAGTLWATVATVVLISVFLHGTTVTPAMTALDRRRERQLDLPLQDQA
ncbi:cation:proton antiporter [Roseomonas chloroacetimidivorans]|uniref:cation:proton antiporter n=1 Tax=Roseomonas chloroacetimidivorans TaxID=1766656 RepID=UPI003C7167CC